ncbi:MAG TPA: metabolite traffic protein EboE [Vicinamibacterales bacterium]|nr:metabolite traffic protein EboE [Vicinamibacterales bacterium]
MRLPPDDHFHLTYCTNIHPASGWDAVFSTLARYAPALKARLLPDKPFGIGLRLSAREARELLAGGRLQTFREFLDGQGLYVALINGFPHGAFHGTVVKADVYAPDWRDEARVRYTLDLIEILRHLLPAGVDGGVSTAPLSYKHWMAEGDEAGWASVTRNVSRVAGALAKVREDHGALIHLDLEPEPDCSIENTDETIAFFERRLLEAGARAVAGFLGCGIDVARARLLEHVRVCFDCCHFAVEFEDPEPALERLTAAGIRIGRAQLSSAIEVTVPADRDAAGAVIERLRAFADPVYLHQVVEQRDGRLARFPDLGEALQGSRRDGERAWRIHFHVPLFTAGYEGLGSTQDYVSRTIGHLLRRRLTTHLEIETYTWDVLPPGLKVDLLESIAREYAWVLDATSSVRP